MDITSITAGLSAVKTAIDITKEIQNASSSLEKAQVKLKLAEITENLANAKLQFVEAQEEIVNLRLQIRTLQVIDDLKNLVKKEGNILLPKESEVKGYGTGPWCTKCFEADGKLISLHHKLGTAMVTSKASFSSYKWECPLCKTFIRAPNPSEL
ncbi:hypothetical protein QX776_06700 [Alteromonadaceae bacterium BrNp21-10]|nr:hypothetical protein [Alteromonadaceae bacterium BrNp21-10]